MTRQGDNGVAKKLADKLDVKAENLYQDVGYVPYESTRDNGDLQALVERLVKSLEERGEFIEALAEDPVPEIIKHDYEDIIRKNRIVFLYFTAEWCGPCINFLEVFRSVALKYLRPGVFFGRVDVDRSFSLADKLNVQHIPTIIVILDGQPVGTLVGRSSREKLDRFVKSYIRKAGF